MVAGGMCGCSGVAGIGYDEIQSMSGLYASYWNAFLFFFFRISHVVNSIKISIKYRKVDRKITCITKLISIF